MMYLNMQLALEKQQQFYEHLGSILEPASLQRDHTVHNGAFESQVESWATTIEVLKQTLEVLFCSQPVLQCWILTESSFNLTTGKIYWKKWSQHRRAFKPDFSSFSQYDENIDQILTDNWIFGPNQQEAHEQCRLLMDTSDRSDYIERKSPPVRTIKALPEFIYFFIFLYNNNGFPLRQILYPPISSEPLTQYLYRSRTFITISSSATTGTRVKERFQLTVKCYL